MDSKHLIHESLPVIEALKLINSFYAEPLVLFVMNKAEQMVGTLTDGDVRRALIAGHQINEPITNIMHRNFNFLRDGVDYDVLHLHEQKERNMKLVPVLDFDDHIVDIIDLFHYRTKLPIDAVLMAGGKGVRLRPLTEKTPKPLLAVGDKCIIDHNVDRLMEFGIEHINVTVNYLREQLEAHFEDPRNGVKVNTVREPEFLGTIGSIRFVEQFYNDTVLVMNSDLFTNIDYEDFYSHFKLHDADMSVAAVPYTVNVPYGIFDLDGRVIRGVKEKPVYNYFANAGIYLIKRSIIDEIPDGKLFNATDLMEKLIAEKKRVIRFPIAGFWLDIGSPAEYAKAQELVKHIKD